MINRNRNYDTSDLLRSERRGAYDRNVSVLQKLFVTLSATAVIMGLILIGIAIGKKDSGTALNEGAPSGAALIVGNISTPTPTVPYTIPEYLTDSDLAVARWGEFEPAQDPVPYEHVPVKGLYTGPASNLEDCFALAENSEINAFVIDLKEAEGVLFDTTNELALETSPVYGYYNLSEVCEQCHEHGIWVIGRIVCFKDPNLAAAYPERAIKDSAGNILYFNTEGGRAFLDPYNEDNWEYLIELAEEAVARGVDEIQFDYIRFPTGTTTTGNEPYYGQTGTVPEKTEAINRFIRTARVRIQDTLGVPLSCDVFGIVVTSDYDSAILGQDWSTIGLAGEDSVCPMIYPSHYAQGTMIGWVTFDKPDLYPYDVMVAVLSQGSTAWYQEGYCTVRPYVQAFTAYYLGEGNYLEYDYEAINDQIRAIQDLRLDEYILWNASVIYPEGNYGGNDG
ncbi:MAG: GTP-binding protein [Clostridiales bacterium]|nr:GTP-binding protein [Clostridiales bacterium]